jgi:gas vesicle protein
MSYQDTSSTLARSAANMTGDPSSASAANAAKDEAHQVGATTKEQASAVAGTAMDSGKQVAAEAKQQALEVTSEARGQIRDLLQQSRDDLREHASAQASRAGANMQTLAEQMTALAQGRPDEAGDLADHLGRCGDRLGAYARRLQDGGLDSVVGDAKGFARRRPGLFLLGAVAAGFAAGRLIRGAQAAGEGSDGSVSESDDASCVASPDARVPVALDSVPAVEAPERVGVATVAGDGLVGDA